MRLTHSLGSALLLFLAAASNVAASPTGSAYGVSSVHERAAGGSSSGSELMQQLAARDSCSNGIKVCCGTASLSCSGGYCKACCGGTCGCFRQPSNTSCNQSTTCRDP